MPDDIIDKIHRMARQQKNNPGLILADWNLSPDECDDDDDDDDDETYHDDDDDNPDDNDNESYHHNDNNDDDDVQNNNDDEDDDGNNDHDGEEGRVDNNEDDDSDGTEANDPPMVDAPEDNEMEGDKHLIENAPPMDDIMQLPDNPPGGIPEVGAVDGEEEEKEDGVVMNHDIPGDVDDETALRIPGVDDNGDNDTGDEQSMTPPDVKNNLVGGYGLRYRWGRNYNHRYAGEDFVVGDDTGVTLATRGSDEVLEMPQMSLKTGLRTFGDDGMKAVEKEMHQLHDRDAMKPVHKKCLTPEQRKEALVYLMFLKRKCCGKIKDRGCADG